MEIDAVPMEVEPTTSFTESFRHRSYVPKLRQAWPDVKSVLEKHGLSGTLNLKKGYITVSTTTTTKDPDIIDRARECIILLTKTRVPPYMAIKVLNGELHHDFIKTGYQEDGFCAIHGIKEEQFLKQRKRLVEHLKDFAHLIGCSVFIDGDCATSVGSSLEHVIVFRTIVKKCIVANVHPAFMVKRLERTIAEVRMARKLAALHI